MSKQFITVTFTGGKGSKRAARSSKKKKESSSSTSSSSSSSRSSSDSSSESEDESTSESSSESEHQGDSSAEEEGAASDNTQSSQGESGPPMSDSTLTGKASTTQSGDGKYLCRKPGHWSRSGEWLWAVHALTFGQRCFSFNFSIRYHWLRNSKKQVQGEIIEEDPPFHNKLGQKTGMIDTVPQRETLK